MFFGHSHSSIDNSYELFICCTCYDNLSSQKMHFLFNMRISMECIDRLHNLAYIGFARSAFKQIEGTSAADTCPF